jgi:hypothetical protein
MTTNPKESQPTSTESQGIPPTTETAAAPESAAETDTAAAVTAEPPPDAGAEVVITVDHVYLPFDEAGKTVRLDWAVTSVSTSRVSRGTRLRVPTDLALLLDKQKQAEILPAPPPSPAPEAGKAGA